MTLAAPRHHPLCRTGVCLPRCSEAALGFLLSVLSPEARLALHRRPLSTCSRNVRFRMRPCIHHASKTPVHTHSGQGEPWLTFPFLCPRSPSDWPQCPISMALPFGRHRTLKMVPSSVVSLRMTRALGWPVLIQLWLKINASPLPAALSPSQRLQAALGLRPVSPVVSQVPRTHVRPSGGFPMD